MSVAGTRINYEPLRPSLLGNEEEPNVLFCQWRDALRHPPSYHFHGRCRSPRQLDQVQHEVLEPSINLLLEQVAVKAVRVLVKASTTATRI